MKLSLLLKMFMWTVWKGCRFSPLSGLKKFKHNGLWDIGDNTVFKMYEEIVLEGNNRIGIGCILTTASSISITGKLISGKIILKPGAMVGSNSVIMPDVIIGEGSIVGACSLVRQGTRIPAGELWCGVPAKFKKKLIFNVRGC